MILPIQKVLENVQRHREESDFELFMQLMYLGEMVTKIITVGMLSTITDDRERHRYRLAYKLVRANGLGDWADVIDDALKGPAAQCMNQEVYPLKNELVKSYGINSWQYDVVALLAKCLKEVNPEFKEPVGNVIAAQWFRIFAELRNKTRGHGAPKTSKYGSICPNLENSLINLINNFSLFSKPWAYLHKNLSGKYRVTSLSSGSTDVFNEFKKSNTYNLQNGVYVFINRPFHVELIESDIDANDFLVPNGNFNDKKYEVLSYFSGNTEKRDSAPYLIPAGELPSSETHGLGDLDVQGKCFGNLPQSQSNYVHRENLETELYNILMDERHPVITLLGRGGIGKTCLALSVLHKVANTDKFRAILWFSARDIDLLAEGPKLVKPNVLKISDIAREFVKMTAPSNIGNKDNDFIDYLSKSLTASPINEPMLFVFDNFETVLNSLEMYNWINTYIRLPNKILITTRTREFKGDYPVEVQGMNEAEADELISKTAKALGVEELINSMFRQNLFLESDGHPYVIKVLLGEVAKAGELVKLERIIASRNEILNALFERTYSSLSPAAKRVFLTLCNWRSVIPQLAVEGVMLRSENEKMDVTEAIDELSRSSFIEVSKSEHDDSLFVSVPLVAAVFGKQKLSVSPLHMCVKADTEFLHMLGASQKSDIKHGSGPRIERMFHNIAQRIAQNDKDIETYIPMLEFIARRHIQAWLLLARLLEEFGYFDRAKEALTRFLENQNDEELKRKAWTMLIRICEQTDDWNGEINAWIGLCQLPNIPFLTISNAANTINRMVGLRGSLWPNEEKEIVINLLIEKLEARIHEASATDFSRLAWLCKHIRNESKLKQYVECGLKLDPDNQHLIKLANKFS